MIRRSQRLSGRQLVEVLKNGKAFHSPLFLVRILGHGSGQSRVASVVPVKIGKTSAVRHLVRRRMYEAVRPFMVKLTPGHLIVMFGKSGALVAKPDEMRAVIEAVFVKAGLLR